MEKLVRLMGTLLVLSLVFVACKKEIFSDDKKGGNDFSAKNDFSNSEKKSSCEAVSEVGQSADNGKKITICHNGHLITISINAVMHHFKQHSDDVLFDCDANVGVTYNDVASLLDQIVQERNLTGNEHMVLQDAFTIWYNEYYLAGNWPIVDNEPIDTTPVVTVPTLGICSNGSLINVSYESAFNYFQNGDVLFSCDPSAGIYYSDVEGPLLDIIYDYALDANASDVMYKAFLIWYTDYYLAGNWPPDGGGAGGGGEGGTGTGSDTTVVINN